MTKMTAANLRRCPRCLKVEVSPHKGDAFARCSRVECPMRRPVQGDYEYSYGHSPLGGSCYVSKPTNKE